MRQNDSVCCQDSSHQDTASLLSSLSFLILENHDHQNLVDTVLLNIAEKTGLNLNKAAYLRESPEFSLVRGVCGYSRPDNASRIYSPDGNLLESTCNYSKKIKAYKTSGSLASLGDKGFRDNLGQELEIENPDWISWRSKHNNRAILLFEKGEEEWCPCKKLLLPRLTNLLCFC